MLDSRAIASYTNPYHPYFGKQKNIADTKILPTIQNGIHSFHHFDIIRIK